MRFISGYQENCYKGESETSKTFIGIELKKKEKKMLPEFTN